MDKRIYLKVKAKSLTEEARIIRQQEAIQKNRARWAKEHEQPEEESEARSLWAGLRGHRRGVVRDEARATQLAYAYLRGKSYRAIEAYSFEPPKWASVESMARRFGGGMFDAGAFHTWTEEPEKARPVRVRREHKPGNLMEQAS